MDVSGETKGLTLFGGWFTLKHRSNDIMQNPSKKGNNLCIQQSILIVLPKS